jgi:hypothetical protein
MPKLPKRSVDLPFFLYRSREDAEAGRESGGTGFFVGVPSQVRAGTYHLYAVSNWHVAVRGGSSIMRLNRMGGGTEIFEYGPEDWIFEPQSYDVAILPFEHDTTHLDVVHVSPGLFADDDAIAQFSIGPGDDVFMPGRFVDLGGHETNTAVLRFGNIAAMPHPVRQSNGASPPSYCIDMHSRSGFSGSPVFVFRTIGQDLETPNLNADNTFLLLLGVHWGQFPESWSIRRRERGAPQQEDAGIEVSLDADEHYIEGMSGMTCAAPVSAINALLKKPAAVRHFEAEEQKLLNGLPIEATR